MPEGTLGFIYQITTADGSTYVGKKQVISTTKKKMNKKELAERPPRMRKTYLMVTKEKTGKNGWANYTGSCDPLNEAIDKGLKYKKEIIHYCSNKKQLSYYEAKYQMEAGCIEPGNKSYNGCVAGKYWAKDLLWTVSDTKQ